jgi:hypothetical protein
LQGSERGIGAAIHFFGVAFCFSAVGDTSYHMQHFCYEVKTKPT